MAEQLSVFGIAIEEEVHSATSLAGLINQATARAEVPLESGDCLVVTQKVVSKAEGMLRQVSSQEEKLALIEAESVRVLRRRNGLIISQTKHGFVCATAGIDESNVPPGYVALLPEDPDKSAHNIRAQLEHQLGISLAVIISDTFGRPWRTGLTDVAIGLSGIKPILDLKSETDTTGRELQVTEIAVADEISGAAELVMGKTRNTPAAIVRGIPSEWLGPGTGQDLLRDPNQDLFR